MYGMMQNETTTTCTLAFAMCRSKDAVVSYRIACHRYVQCWSKGEVVMILTVSAPLLEKL